MICGLRWPVTAISLASAVASTACDGQFVAILQIAFWSRCHPL